MKAEAHGLSAESTGPNAVRFTYDDGSPLTRGYIAIYDAAGEELAKDSTDADGMFDYSAYKDVAKLVAEDVFGHRVEYVLDMPKPDNKGAIVVGVLIALLGAAAASHFATRKARCANETLIEPDA